MRTSVGACFIVLIGLHPANAQQAVVDPAISEQIELQSTSRAIILMREPDPQDVDPQSTLAFSSPAEFLADVLGTTLAENVGAIEGTPAAVAELDSEALEILRRNPAVQLIVEDVADPPSLLDTASILKATDFWQVSGDASGQTIAVLDTGIDPNHPFFHEKIVAQICFSVEDATRNVDHLCHGGEVLPGGIAADASELAASRCPEDTRGCSHGTHVAGIAVGGDTPRSPSDPAVNIAGIAKGADLVAVQVFSRFNDPADCGGNAPCVKSFRSAQLAALVRIKEGIEAEELRISAINMSLGGERHFRACDALSALTDEINQLLRLGVPTFVAAGNDGFRNAVSHPACISSAVTVGATGKEEGAGLASFSNRRHDMIDLVTVGVDVESSVPGGSFAPKDGTSMAAPAAAGAFLLLRSAFPDASVSDILFAMKEDDCALDQVMDFRYPCIDVATAKIRLDSMTTTGDSIAATHGAEAAPRREGGTTRFMIFLNPSSDADQAAVEAIERAAVSVGGAAATLSDPGVLGDHGRILETTEPIDVEELRRTLRREVPDSVDRLFPEATDVPQ